LVGRELALDVGALEDVRDFGHDAMRMDVDDLHALAANHDDLAPALRLCGPRGGKVKAARDISRAGGSCGNAQKKAAAIMFHGLLLPLGVYGAATLCAPSP